MNSMSNRRSTSVSGRRRRLAPAAFGALLGLLAGGAPAAAQVAWDAPLLVAPQSQPGWGLFLVDPSPGEGLGFLGTWRGNGPVGFRLGLAEGWRDELAVYGGVDLSGGLLRSSGDQPFNVDWVAGAGLGAGEAILLSFPLGLTVGAVFQGDGFSVGPYLTPRLVLDAWMGDDDSDGPGNRRDRDDVDLDLAADLGVDVGFGARWSLRFGVTLGDREALAIGASFR